MTGPAGPDPAGRRRGGRRRHHLPRPSPRRLGAALALLGLLAAVAFLVVPVDAAFADDPLLRYGVLIGAQPAVTDVDCGVPVNNLRRRPDGLGLYDLARTDACREAATRRAATAAAAGGLVAVLGLFAATAATAEPSV